MAQRGTGDWYGRLWPGFLSVDGVSRIPEDALEKDMTEQAGQAQGEHGWTRRKRIGEKDKHVHTRDKWGQRSSREKKREPRRSVPKRNLTQAFIDIDVKMGGGYGGHGNVVDMAACRRSRWGSVV